MATTRMLISRRARRYSTTRFRPRGVAAVVRSSVVRPEDAASLAMIRPRLSA
jgi:hypothetical protein